MAQFQTRAAAFARLESPAPLSFPVAAAALARLGLVLKSADDDGGLVINFAHGPEASAVYCDDVAEAADVGLDMLARKSRAARFRAELVALGVPSDMAARDALAAASGRF